MAKRHRKHEKTPTRKTRFIDRYFWHLIAAAVLVAGAVNLLLWFSPGADTRQTGISLPSYPAAQVELGQRLYQANCATCHGVDGAGYAQAGIPAPALNGSMHSWHHTDQQISGWIRGGLGQMPAVGATWSDEEVEAVLAYIKQWWDPEQLAWQTEASGSP